MTYIGSRDRHGRHGLVRIHDEATDTDYGPLPPRHDLRVYACDAFDWSREGTGAALLAVSLLAHHLGDDVRAINLHRSFYAHVVQRLPHKSWSLTAARIDAEIAAIEADRRGDVAF